MTRKEHKLRKIVKSGARLCSFISETRDIVVSEAPDLSYVLKTGNGRQGSLRMVFEIPPVGIIGLGLSASTILLEIVLREASDLIPVDVLPGLKLKWPQKRANQVVGKHVIVQETPWLQFTFQDIQYEADFRLLNLDKLFVGAGISLKRLRFTPSELSSDQTDIIIGQYPI